MDSSLLLRRRQEPGARLFDDWPGALAVFAVATALAVLAIQLGWRGSDLPAQVFRAELVRRDGFVLWNSQWFGGHATLAYSVLSPLLSALTGAVLLGAMCGVASAVLFERIVRYGFGRVSMVGPLWFAASTVTNLVVGRVTFALGVAIGLGAVLALQHRRVVLAALAAVACSLASPVAGLFLAIGACACAITQPQRRVAAIVTGFGALAPIGIVTLLFRNIGVEPYEPWNFAWDLALCLAVIVLVPRRYNVLRWAAALYALTTIVSFVVPSPLGSNVSRLDQYIAGPLLACALLPRRRVLIAMIAVPLLIWQWFPALDGMVFAHADPSTQRSYYTPLLDFLATQPPTLGRVEVPPTYRHWESAYVAPTVALARGWERQLDIGYNPLFYDGHLTSGAYEDWLADNAVEYVALPDARLDPSSHQEAALLVHGTRYLHEIWHDAHWRVWRFVGYRGLVDGSATMVSLSPDRFVIDVTQPGDVTVRVRSSSHWAVRDDDGCITSTSDGWTRVHAAHAGRLEVVQALAGTGCGS